MSRIAEILSEAHDHLKVVRSGVAMISGGQGEARVGLRNVAVFGRMVTFAINHLRSQVSGFEEWDTKAKSRHFDRPECHYMYKLRNVIEKEARTPTSVAVYISSFNSEDIGRLQRPTGATRFLFGDHQGGNGWVVKGADGKEEMFYVSLPPEIGQTWLTLPEFETAHKPAAEVANTYADALTNYLMDVTAFVHEASSQ